MPSGALGPPFGSDPTYANLTTTHLTIIDQVTVDLSKVRGVYQFGYDSAGAGELTSVILPYGGELSWNYTSFAYNGGRTMREVGTRYLAADSQHATTWTYPITRPDAPNTVTVHSAMTLTDASGIGAKTWDFINSGSNAWQLGLVSQFVQSASLNGTVLENDSYTWSQDPAGNPYISAKSSAADPGSSDPQSAYSTQALDRYGNVTQSVIYPYNNTTTPIKTYANTYLNSSTYTSNYIFNRLVSTVLTPAGGTPVTLVQNTYDTNSNCTSYFYQSPTASCSGWVTPTTGPTTGIDPSPPILLGQRGYLNSVVTPAVTTSNMVYTYGAVAASMGSDGSTTTMSADASTNYAAPVTITSQSYTQTLAYTQWLGVTQTTGSNGEQMSMTYDGFGRPASATSPFGATATYTYSTSVPFSQTKTGPDGVTTTTLDGLGRPILVARGDSSGVHAYTSTVYAPCACSPLGKVQQVSQPYAPSATEYWTTYTYDGLGRTVALKQPDGVSSTTYSYLGNATTITDPASKQKQFTTNSVGDLTGVVETDPCVPTNTLTTAYLYDWMHHVTSVTMTRPNASYSGSGVCSEPGGSVTQTRTFVYDNAGRLTSATNPENGTASYVYNSDNTLQYKQDAKGQQTVYTYDSLKRLTMTQYFPQGQQGAAGEDSCQRVTYSWDTNPINASFSHYSYGRLTAVRYGLTTGNTSPYRTFCVSGTQNSYFTLGYLAGMWVETSFAEMYSYQPAGAVTAKQLGVARNSGTNPCYCNFGSSFNATLEVDYTYDSAGRTTSTTYPMTSVVPVGGVSSPMGTVTLTYGYDSLGRPNSLTDQSGASGAGWRQTSGSVNWVQNVQYDYAGRLSSIQSINGSRYAAPNYSPTWTQETMNYNVSGQLNSLGWAFNPNGAGFGTASAITYAYSATQNNGQITQVQDQLSGETISYQYDALKRLSSASSTPISGSTPTAWTQGYQFDGFGNLTAKVLNGTSAALPVNAATNQLSNASYDANGNMTSGSGATLTYDEANRVFSAQETSGGIEYYGYTADSKRFYKYPTVGTEQLTFYGARGEKLGVYALGLQSQGGPLAIWPVETNIWFAGKLIVESNDPAYLDRLGTNRGGYFSGSFSGTGTRFYPYGDEITSTVNDHEKFATYTRDGYTGFDYADQRFYASTYGRFNTPDPYQRSVRLRNPSSWNRYSYTLGDPVNGTDPTGLFLEDAGGDQGDFPDDGFGTEGGGDGGGASGWTIGTENGYFNPAATGTGVETTDTITYLGADGSSGTETVYGYQVIPDPQVDSGIAQTIGGFVGLSAIPALGVGTAGAVAGATGYLGSVFGIGAAAAGVGGSLDGNQVESAAVDVGTTVYRVFGGTSPQFGRFWTTVDPTTVPNYPNAAGLPPGNTAESIVTGILNNLTGVTTTIATRIGNNLGGLSEVNVPNSACQITVVCVGPFRGIP